MLNVRARTSSILYMSDVKRFKIRPVGVVSKKLIGDLKIAYAIRSWSFRDAYKFMQGQLLVRTAAARIFKEHCKECFLTSIEQKIHNMSVCITVRRAPPTPNAI